MVSTGRVDTHANFVWVSTDHVRCPTNQNAGFDKLHNKTPTYTRTAGVIHPLIHTYMRGPRGHRLAGQPAFVPGARASFTLDRDAEDQTRPTEPSGWTVARATTRL